MTEYLHTSTLASEICCNCGMAFAMPKDYQERRRKDHESFYCPAGHRQHYLGETEETKLRRKLESTEHRLSQEEDRRERAEEQSRQKERKYARIRDRVKNGVCPCCNRTFLNLGNHMKSQHPDFGTDKQLKTMRLLYGLTQADLASEIGVSTAVISCAERGKAGISENTHRRIEDWLASA